MNVKTRRPSVVAGSLLVVALLLFSVLYHDIIVGPGSSMVESQATGQGRLALAQEAATTAGLIIPMFTNYSLVEVGGILQAKAANPNVPIIVVANPAGGPGAAYNATYAAGLKSLQASGITVLGYVATGWGENSIPSIEAQIRTFQQWYGVQGIYLDQMYNLEFSQTGTYLPTYYSTLSAYIRSLGMGQVFGNSGTEVPYYFVGTVGIIGEFENAHLPTLGNLSGWQTGYAKTDFAFFAYNVSSVDPYFVAAASSYIGYLFVTNGERPFPYGHLPPYFGQLVSELGSLVPVTIETATPNGTIVDRGFNVTVTQPDGISTSGFAPSTFQVVKGSTVTVSLKDYGGYVFDHWADGGTNATITISPTLPTTLVASSRTAETNISLVTVHSVETKGVPVTGIWTLVYQAGSIVAGGFTPFTFTATKGLSYTFTMANYSGYSFAGWAGGVGVSNGTALTLTPKQDVVVNAYLNNETVDQP